MFFIIFIAILSIFSASSVPVSSITWWFNGNQIGRENQDKNYKIFGKGPTSQLYIGRTSFSPSQDIHTKYNTFSSITRHSNQLQDVLTNYKTFSPITSHLH
jgi:hypothetical protein